jgi:hypothetical protein
MERMLACEARNGACCVGSGRARLERTLVPSRAAQAWLGSVDGSGCSDAHGVMAVLSSHQLVSGLVRAVITVWRRVLFFRAGAARGEGGDSQCAMVGECARRRSAWIGCALLGYVCPVSVRRPLSGGDVAAAGSRCLGGADFRTLALPLVAALNPLRLQSKVVKVPLRSVSRCRALFGTSSSPVKDSRLESSVLLRKR